MILSKLVIKNFFYNFISNTHVSAVYFRKKINGLIGVMVLTLVMTTTKAIRRVNDKMFLILLCQQVTHNTTICKRIPS